MPNPRETPLMTTSLTTIAMIAFAGNSILCRLALKDAHIDPASFTVIRIASGAAFLAVLVVGRSGFKIRNTNAPWSAGTWLSAIAVAAYAAFFSYSYLDLDAGTGALVLFATVQVTMIGTGIARGRRPLPLEWLGLALSLGGLVYLVAPWRSDAPDPVGVALMAVAGVGWGAYSLRGKAAGDPTRATTGNFIRALPLVLPTLLISLDQLDANTRGLTLAIISGALTSGAGYAVWYAALRTLHGVTASIVQLSVPALAAVGGVALLGEPITAPFIIACVLILGGVAIAVVTRARSKHRA
ncbi:MAG: DMT family transporter [Planctomycetota bacterium]